MENYYINSKSGRRLEYWIKKIKCTCYSHPNMVMINKVCRLDSIEITMECMRCSGKKTYLLLRENEHKDMYRYVKGDKDVDNDLNMISRPCGRCGGNVMVFVGNKFNKVKCAQCGMYHKFLSNKTLKCVSKDKIIYES